MEAIVQENARRVFGLVEDFEHAIAGHAAPIAGTAAQRRPVFRSLLARLSLRRSGHRLAGPTP